MLMPWAKTLQKIQFFKRCFFEAFIAEPWLVGNYLNIFSAIILSTIKPKKLKKKLGGMLAFLSKIFNFKIFFEVMIAKLWLVGIYLNIFPVIILSLIIIIINWKKKLKGMLAFLSKSLDLKICFWSHWLQNHDWLEFI